MPNVPATSEFNDKYLNVDLMITHRGEEARGRVNKKARDNDENPMGRANANPILESHQYVVKFEDSTEAELAANDIAQSMYDQCDPEGNQYILLDSIVEFFRSTTVLCYEDQKFVRNGCIYLCR